MAAQNLGTLADYLVNGDNYERVLPDGNVLVIPGNQVGTKGFPPLAPQGDQVDAYREPTADCLSSSIGGTCAAWVHDATTGFYHIGPIADFNTAAGESCICALAAEIENPNCLHDLQAQIDALGGYSVGQLLPRWFLAELGIDQAQPFRPDFWFIACYSAEVIIPNQPLPPPPITCPKGWLLVNGVCIDPPLPQILPHAFRARPTATPLRSTLIKADSHAAPSISPGPPLPMMKAGPIHPSDCGCDEDRATEDEIGYEMVEA